MSIDTTEIQRTLGNLETGLTDLSRRQTESRLEQREDFRRVFEKLEKLNNHGCSLGEVHSRDIKELQEKPERWIGIGAAIIAAFAAIAAFWKGHG